MIWIKHDGGKCPIAIDQAVWVRRTTGDERVVGQASNTIWDDKSSNPITHYAIIPEPIDLEEHPDSSTIEGMIAVCYGRLNKEELQRFDIEYDDWFTIPEESLPTSLEGDRWRIKPKEPKRLPSINWDHVHKDFVCLTEGNKAQSGVVLLHKEYPKPTQSNTTWALTKGCIQATTFASYDPGNVPWEEAIVYRPGFEPKEEGR